MPFVALQPAPIPGVSSDRRSRVFRWSRWGPAPPERAPALLLHGLGSSLADWEYQIPSLSDDRPVVALDLRGHGRSERRGPYGAVPMAADGVAFLDWAEGPVAAGRVHLVGVSMGAMVAVEMALARPGRLASLTLINGPLRVVFDGWWQWLNYGVRVGLAALLGPRAVGRTLAPQLFPRDDQEALRQVFIERWARNGRWSYLNAMRGLVGWSAVDRLDLLEPPTLVVYGEADHVSRATAEGWAERIPESELRFIAGSGHATPADRPETLNRELRAFFERSESLAEAAAAPGSPR